MSGPAVGVPDETLGAVEPVEPVEPVEERLARRLDDRAAAGHPVAARTSGVLHRLGRYDRAAYVAVARLSTPGLDIPLSRLSHFANHSKPWFLVAGALALFGGGTGRRAALNGVAAIGAASLVVNQPMKLAGNRDRPDREGHEVPEARWVEMPTSTSFPSGHSASALAFAVAVGDVIPALRWPLRVAGGTVAFSRVYTGVHYPGDVLVGAVTGALLGRVVSRRSARRRARR
ncbi:MAG TPA: phosphatase PAP2 family protein [Ornithinibacter sp.]|nr:phosphatase PAP2 family protein [Ornithinibacter sp.]